MVVGILCVLGLLATAWGDSFSSLFVRLSRQPVLPAPGQAPSPAASLLGPSGFPVNTDQARQRIEEATGLTLALNEAQLSAALPLWRVNGPGGSPLIMVAGPPDALQQATVTAICPLRNPTASAKFAVITEVAKAVGEPELADWCEQQVEQLGAVPAQTSFHGVHATFGATAATPLGRFYTLMMLAAP